VDPLVETLRNRDNCSERGWRGVELPVPKTLPKLFKARLFVNQVGALEEAASQVPTIRRLSLTAPRRLPNFELKESRLFLF
jgi:hypothetical protein